MSNEQSDYFTGWMNEQLGVEAFEIENWVGADSGYSNETAIFDARFKQQGMEATARFVRRAQPPGPSMFKEYDLKRQYGFMDYLSLNSSVPVPPLVGFALDHSPPYYVMNFVSGEVSGDGHTAPEAYLNRGFLVEGSPEQRRRYFESLITQLAELHRVFVAQDFRNAYRRADAGVSALQAEVDWWVDLYHWGKDYQDLPLDSDKHVDWLANNVPTLDDANIIWGDARPANTIVDDYQVAALLDWELASFGPGEIDLFFHIGMHNHRENQPGAIRLDGVPSEAEQIEIYEQAIGRPVRHADFFRALAYTRMAIISLIFCRANGIPADQVPYDNSYYMNRLENILGI